MDGLTCVTWNVHRARGADGRVDPDRVAGTLLRDVWHEDVDVLALQEADAETPPHEGLLDLGRIAERTRLRHAHPEPHLRWGPASTGFLGSVLLVRADWELDGGAVIDLPGRCHRGAIAVEARRGAAAVRLVATHLSLWQPLRMAQMRTVGQYLRRVPPMPTVVLGDLNEWRPWGGLAFSRRLLGRAFDGPSRATFPSVWPVLPLDRILGADGAAVRDARVLDSPAIRATSDHRPLQARVTLPG